MLRHLSWETGAFTVTLNTRLLYWYAASKQAKVRKFEMLMRWTCKESKFFNRSQNSRLFQNILCNEFRPWYAWTGKFAIFREPTQIFPQCNWVFETFFQIISSSIYTTSFFEECEILWNIIVKGSILTNKWLTENEYPFKSLHLQRIICVEW